MTTEFDSWAFKQCVTNGQEIEGVKGADGENIKYVNTTTKEEFHLGDKCPECGSYEVEAFTPRTVYSCGSSDYDQRDGTFKKGKGCN